jgi:hypothetical protein
MNENKSKASGLWGVMQALWRRLFTRKKKKPNSIYPLR